MNTILKRLQIVQAALTLEDRALIDSQRAAIAAALPDLAAAEDLRRAITDINHALAQGDYPQAQNLIGKLLAQASTLTVREDPACSALKLQLAALEQRCTELNQQHDDLNHRIEGFNRRYSLRLGDTIVKILKLQMMIAHYQALDGTDADAQAAYAEAQQHYQDFHAEHEAQREQPAPLELDEDAQQRLKKAYRRASRLCHPDMVEEARKAQAAEQFKALNAAYRKNDLAAVERILAALQSGGGFATVSEQADDKALLRQQIDALQQRIAELEQDIAALQADDTWQLIASLSDEAACTAYLDEQERLLNAELKRLQVKLRDLTG